MAVCSSSSSKFNNRQNEGEKKRAVRYKGIFCDEEERPFTAEWYETRKNIQKTLNFYRHLLVNTKLLHPLTGEHGKIPESRRNSGLKLHIRAANKVFESMGEMLNNAKQVGHISGIKVGDEFYWRAELSIVGLHHDFQKGIDCMKMLNGKTIATSIVDSGRYDNHVAGISSDSGTLVYCGEGENPKLSCGKKPKDQKLVRGNLALKNSMDEKLSVRVIRRIMVNNNNVDSGCNTKFVYDGLYCVTEYWKGGGEFGTDVYKFLLRKCEEIYPRKH